MKILFISMVAFENNTSATIQNKGIIRGLVATENEVDIMTLRPNQNSVNYDESINDINDIVRDSYYIDIDPRYAALMAKKTKSNKITYNDGKNSLLKIILRKGRNFIKSIYDNFSVFDAQKINIKGIANIDIDYSHYDVIISASDPKSSHLISDYIMKNYKNCEAKWIQYWGDPMLNDITRKSGWKDFLVKHYENKLITKADKIIYASPLTLEKQKQTFPKVAFKMDYASQVYVNIKNQITKDKEEKISTDIEVGYFGAYKSTIRNIMPLYFAAKDRKIKLNICGYSDILLEDTQSISIHGVIPYEYALKMEEESDILICICNNKGTQIPGKIYYCTSYKKPIIVVLDGEYTEELREYFSGFNRFILCENNKESIIDAIGRAKAQIKKQEYIICEKLTPEYMARKILRYL